MDEADTLTTVPADIPDGWHKGQRAVRSHSPPGHQQPQKWQDFVVIVLMFVDDLAQAKMKACRNP